MQRNYRFLWLALIPLGAVGALATGLVPLPWQSASEQPQAFASATAARAEADQHAAVQQSPRHTQPTRSTSADGASGQRLPFGIDVARLSGIGSSVIAGYGKPGSAITVMADGKPIGVVTADAQGDWVLVTSHKFAHLDPKITLKIGDHIRKTVAALDSAANSADGPTRISSDAPKRSAADVTRQMLLRLKELTEEVQANEAQANAEPVISNASKSPQQATSFRPSPSARSTRNAVVTGSVARQPAATPSQADQSSATVQLPGAAGPATVTNTPAIPVPTNASRRTAPRQIAAAAPSVPKALNAKTRQSAKSVPVPVQFVYRRADFTDQGRQAAALLLKYFKAKNFKSIVLSGHADERGSTSANQALSRQRLERIRDLLREGGFTGEIKLVPKGETEKYRGVDRSQFEAEELYQLDRRVEVMSAR